MFSSVQVEDQSCDHGPGRGLLTGNQLFGKEEHQKKALTSYDSFVLGKRAQYKITIQELKTWRPMFCIIILAIIAAEVNNILKEIVKERSILLNNPHNMKGRMKLSNMCVGVVRCKEGEDGDDFIEEEEGGGIARL